MIVVVLWIMVVFIMGRVEVLVGRQSRITCNYGMLQQRYVNQMLSLHSCNCGMSFTFKTKTPANTG